MRKMSDETNNNSGSVSNMPPLQGGNGPRLRKIKRPIKKLVQRPLPGQPQPARPAMPQQPKNTEGMPKAPEDNMPFMLSENENKISDAAEENYNANLPQKNTTPVNFNQEIPQFINDSDLETPHGVQTLMQGDLFTRKAMGIAALIMFIVGFIFAKFFFTEETVVRDGLQGVIVNPEVPRGRARCGVAEKMQGCVLYIMNPQRQELNARDFYDLASQLTGRQRFVIETGNMRYSNVKIAPGEIGQFNIPPLQ